MAGIDLTNARKRVADRVYLDRCSIFRDPATSTDRVLDDTTGELIEGPGDADVTTLATNVRCSIRPGSSTVASRDVSSTETIAASWTVSMAYDEAPVMIIGDRVVLTVSADPMLLGLDLFVSEVESGTLRVARRVTVGRSVGAYGPH